MNNRRTFLQMASLGAAALGVQTNRVYGNQASDKLVVGVIGCGGRGMQDANSFGNTQNVEVAYLCDVDQTRLEAGLKATGLPSERGVSDMRRILDDKSIDAVVITTPDHWHSPAAILACDAGKHVYVEKPMSHNIREGRLVVKAADRNRRLVQQGTQCRSTRTMMEAMKRLQDGLIGTILTAKAWNIQLRESIGHAQPSAPPAELDYDNWVGPAPMIPYQSNRVHNRWTWWHNFGVGDIGDDGIHDLDYARWGLGVNSHPNKIVAQGGNFFFDDDREFPDTQHVVYEYSGDGKPGDKRVLIFEQRLWSTNYPYNVDSGVEFYGTKGQMFLSRRGKVQIRDQGNKVVQHDIPLEPQNDAAHVQNFCDAIRSGTPLNADARVGHLSASLSHLGNIATRVGRAIQFDPDAEKVLNDDAADTLVAREYRDHWSTPHMSANNS